MLPSTGSKEIQQLRWNSSLGRVLRPEWLNPWSSKWRSIRSSHGAIQPPPDSRKPMRIFGWRSETPPQLTAIAASIISHTMEMMLAAMAGIWGGVCERHPKIRIGFLESGGGWIAPWLDRMDRHFDDQGFNDSGLKTRPSELFQRNCWISFEPVENSIKVLADYIGPHKILWATDYPHPDGFFPGAPKMVLERLEGLSPETRHQVMAGGAMGFYGLT